MKKKNNQLIFIGIIILALVVLVYFGYSSLYGSSGAKIGEPCGFDFQFCEKGLFCHVAGISESTGKYFGSCSETPNYLGEIEACGPTILACCGKDLICAKQPDGNNYCFKKTDNVYLNYPIVNEKPCY